MADGSRSILELISLIFNHQFKTTLFEVLATTFSKLDLNTQIMWL